MQIHIANLPVEGITLEVDEPTKRFPVLVALAAQGEARFLDNICGRLQVKRMHDMVVVTGEITAQACLTCSRCLERGEYSIKKEINIMRPVSESKVIDISEIARDEIILDYPIKLLCRDDCNGICPGCGNNLNKRQCVCSKEQNFTRGIEID